MAPKKGSKPGGAKAAPPILKDIRQHAGDKAWLKEQASKANAHYLVRLHHAKQLLAEKGQEAKEKAQEALQVLQGQEKQGGQVSAHVVLTIAEAMEKSGVSAQERGEYLIKYLGAEWNEEQWTNPLHELDAVSSSITECQGATHAAMGWSWLISFSSNPSSHGCMCKDTAKKWVCCEARWTPHVLWL
jgi:hypothetical protein